MKTSVRVCRAERMSSQAAIVLGVWGLLAWSGMLRAETMTACSVRPAAVTFADALGKPECADGECIGDSACSCLPGGSACMLDSNCCSLWRQRDVRK